MKIGGNTQFVTIEGIAYDAGIDIQSPNPMIGMHIKTPSIPLFVEGVTFSFIRTMTVMCLFMA